MDTAVVTGASGGVGEAVARLFAEEGAHVVICSREADAIDDVAEGIRESGGEATAMRADVRDEYDVERLLETAARAGDAAGVDRVVANAGVYHGAYGDSQLSGESYAAFDDGLRVNARGVFATIREAVPHLTDDARALVPAGRSAREPTAGFGAYAVSKAAAVAVARQFAAELEWVVGVVDPGPVATDLTGGEGDRTPEDVAPLFHWAATAADPDIVDGRVVDADDREAATG
jgi:NAD(P)-dependent dehydrogenase (short-subunit alcohol dehydrogenase family)